MSINVFLATDDEMQGAVVRKVLHREGLDCPAANVVRVDLAPQMLPRMAVDLVVVGLPDDSESSLRVLDWLEKMPRISGQWVVAIGPTADAKVLLRALRGAIDDYLDRTNLEVELMAALGRWRATMMRQERAGKVIAVLAPSGGSGSSTLAVNLATVLAKLHKSAALIDLKLETGDLAALLDLRPTYTLADLCHNIARMDRTLFEHSLTRHASGVHLLGAPGHYDDVARVTPEGVHQALALAKSSFPYVLVDLDHSFRAEQVEVLREADCVLLVVRLDFASLRNAHRALELLERLGVDSDRIYLVVNRYGQPKEIPFSKAEEALGMKIFHYVPDDPRAINRANNNGVPVVTESPSSRVAKSITKLANSVNGRQKEPAARANGERPTARGSLIQKLLNSDAEA
jgi:pilus assembly protein CpaE